MPSRQFITGVPGVQVLDVIHGNTLEIRGIAEVQNHTVCPQCGTRRFRVKATKERTFKHGIWGQQLVLLKIKVPKLLCRQCGRYFVLKIPGILPKKRSTEQFRQDVFHLHQGGLTQTRLSQSHAISGSTVERWYQDFVAYRRFSKNNGITEGFHTKMEMISRRAYGFRNFKNYRLRVIALCGWDGVFAIRN
jgi:transposase